MLLQFFNDMKSKKLTLSLFFTLVHFKWFYFASQRNHHVIISKSLQKILVFPVKLNMSNSIATVFLGLLQVSRNYVYFQEKHFNLSLDLLLSDKVNWSHWWKLKLLSVF